MAACAALTFFGGRALVAHQSVGATSPPPSPPPGTNAPSAAPAAAAANPAEGGPAADGAGAEGDSGRPASASAARENGPASIVDASSKTSERAASSGARAASVAASGSSKSKERVAADENEEDDKERNKERDKDKEDKDVARDSWRANLPGVLVSGDKAVMIVPIKGSTRGSKYNLIRKTKTLVVKLPKAVSLDTMHFYSVKRAGFRQLWVEQAETNPKPADGTTLKVVFSEAVEPVVDVKDDYVRVAIRAPGRARGDGR